MLLGVDLVDGCEIGSRKGNQPVEFCAVFGEEFAVPKGGDQDIGPVILGLQLPDMCDHVGEVATRVVRLIGMYKITFGKTGERGCRHADAVAGNDFNTLF